MKSKRIRENNLIINYLLLFCTPTLEFIINSFEFRFRVLSISVDRLSHSILIALYILQEYEWI